MTTIQVACSAFALGFAAMVADTAVAASPSFDCAKARTWSEHQVCGDAALAALDVTLGSAYKAQVAQTDGSEKKRLISDQKRWLMERDNCEHAGVPSQCLIAIYSKRMSELTPSQTIQVAPKDQPTASPIEITPKVVSNHDSGYDYQVKCYTGSSNSNLGPIDGVRVYSSEISFSQDQEIRTVMHEAFRKARQQCASSRSKVSVCIASSPNSCRARGVLNQSGGVEFYSNDEGIRLAAENKLLKKQRVYQQVDQPRREALLAFLNGAKVSAIPNSDDLASNPFAYKGKNVPVIGTWDDMRSESEVIFRAFDESTHSGGVFLVSGVPLDAVHIHSRALVVGTVVGKRDIPTPFGQTQLPELRYVAARPITAEEWRHALTEFPTPVADLNWAQTQYEGR